MQSPYCWFVLDRLKGLNARPDVTVMIRPVRPGALRLPDTFRDRSPMEMAYFEADVQRTAAFLGLTYAQPDPSPVVFEPGCWVAAPNQPLVDRLYGLFAAACAQGQGLAFVDIVMPLIWDGRTRGWDAVLESVVSPLGLTPVDATETVTANEAEMYATGHWGVPLMVYRGEPFYGQDRFDQLVWRIGENDKGNP